MQQENKVACYRKAYQTMKNNGLVSNLNYPDDKRNLIFTCNLGNISFEYNLRLKSDLLTIRATMHFEGLADSELTERAEELLNGKHYMFTAYNENVIFQLSKPIIGMTDAEAVKILDTETEEFVRFLEGIASFDGKQTGQQTFNPEEEPEESTGVSKDENTADDADITEDTENVKPGEQDSSEYGNEVGSLFDDLEDEEKPEVKGTGQSSGFMEKETIPEKVVETEQENGSSESDIHAAEQQESDRENRLLQLEWIAEKNASNRRKEAALNQKEEELVQREQQLNEKLRIAEEKTALWKQMEEKYADHETKMEQERTAIAEQSERIQKKEADILQLAESCQLQKTQLDQREQICAESEEQMKRDLSSLQKLQQETEEKRKELDALGKELESKMSVQSEQNEALDKAQNDNKSLKERCLFLQNELKAEQEKYSEINEIYEKYKTDTEEALTHAGQEDREKYEKALADKENELQERNKEIHELTLKLSQKEEALSVSDKSGGDLKNEINEIRKTLMEKDQQIATYQKQIELYKENDVEMGMPDEILEDFADTRKLNRQLQREVEDLKAEVNGAKDSCEKEVLSVKQEYKDFMDKINVEKEAMLPENLMAHYMEELKKNGIVLHVSEKHDEMCLVGNRDGCEIELYINKKVLIVTKEIARANKLAAKLMEYSKNDITETYFCEKRSVTCKKTYSDVVLDISKVLQKFGMLK